MLQNLLRFRTLVWELVRVELTGQFKRSFLGSAWLFVAPLMVVLVWLLLYAAGVFNPGETSVPYPAYVLLSVTLWNFFSGFYQSVGKSISQSAPLLLQASFPHEVVVASKVLADCIYFAIPMAFNVGVLWWVGVSFSWGSWLFPVAVLPLFLLGMSLGLIFSMIEVVALDVYNAFAYVLRVLFYLSPVVYSEQVSSLWLQKVLYWNPLTHLLSGARDVLLLGTLPMSFEFLISAAFATILFILASVIYYRAEHKILERLTA